MRNPLEELVKELSRDMFTVIQLSVKATQDGLSITCGGSKVAVESFSEELGADLYDQIKDVMETALRKVNEIICSSEHCNASIDVLELKRQAGGMNHAG